MANPIQRGERSMTVRLVFVSLMACLGLTLPSAERLSGWSRGGQAGPSAGLGGPQDGVPINDDRFVFVADALEVPKVSEETVVSKPAPEETVVSKPAPEET